MPSWVGTDLKKKNNFNKKYRFRGLAEMLQTLSITFCVIQFWIVPFKKSPDIQTVLKLLFTRYGSKKILWQCYFN